jgi:hypothetical protein
LIVQQLMHLLIKSSGKTEKKLVFFKKRSSSFILTS